MCITVFLWQAHPLYPFLLLLNRDEFHSRPTKPAGWWEGEDIIGGRDEVGGGTWLACSKSGRVAFLTNFRESESNPDAKSRGDLPVRFLKSKKNPSEFADEVIQEFDQYNGFNLIVADICSKTMVYLTNRPKENKPSALQVSPGIHVLTNSSLDSPWPKAQRLHHNFKELMDTYNEGEVQVHEMVEKLMTDTTKADKSSLPGILSPNFEHQLSSIFIDTDSPRGRYGTRSTSVVLVKVDGEVCFHERYLEDNSWKEHAIKYQIE
ncbi:hypothetical protein SOVF_145770 [Spinacia oleracea]|uniref:Transport and Golgi organization protein 2 homolog n=1 Tax=Spinacia oleracea TaxID=3562 RepID=A0A9R0K0F6_SPIOL|nr:uncharacterized protein LOC110793327 [Spinacia oleracea]KNA10294.1 hypothetical protein SOVF_145770 [Spinacia oleracea]